MKRTELVERAKTTLPPGEAFLGALEYKRSGAQASAMFGLIGVREDPALRALREADENGDADAAFRIGQWHQYEKDDVGEAEKAYRRADERGHGEAAFNLGCSTGTGATSPSRSPHTGGPYERDTDVAGAMDCYRRAIARGEPRGAPALAHLEERRRVMGG